MEEGLGNRSMRKGDGMEGRGGADCGNGGCEAGASSGRIAPTAADAAGSGNLVEGRYSIKDLVDIDRLRQLFDRFSEMTGFSVGLNSCPDQEVLIATGWTDICAKFHRICPEARKLCIECDTRLTEKLKRLKEFSMNHCVNGLVNAATPVIIKGKHIADLHVGQVLFDKPDMGRFIDQAQTYGFDTERYLEAAARIPVVSEETIRKTVSFMGEIAYMIAEQGLHKLMIEEGKKELEREMEESRNLEMQVQYAQKLESLGVLAGGIAHDFNNLIMAVMGNASLALEELDPSSPAMMSVMEIERASARAADLCEQMLAYSGRGSFSIKELDLAEIIKEMTHMLIVSISKSIDLEYHFGEGLLPVEADATQMRQVIMNLMTNASEAIGDKDGMIVIRAETRRFDSSRLRRMYLGEELSGGMYSFIEVSDDGCGMDEKTQSRIFDPFFTTKFVGRGLGMAAVLGIVRGHGGAIEVQSEIGKGTTVRVLFPALGEGRSKEIEKAPERSDAVGGWRGSGTVLFVDDEEPVRDVSRRMLELAGFDVLTAADGFEAIELFKKNHGRIVCTVLDLTMPHMDSGQVFRELKSIKSEVPIIISSGYDELEVVKRFSGKVLAGFIHKPYRMRNLVSKLREVLGE